MRGWFILGTNYGVGKTTVGASIASALVRRGLRVAASKPIEVGCPFRLEDAGDRNGHGQVDGMVGEVDDRARQALNRLSALVGPPPITVSTKSSPAVIDPVDTRYLKRFTNVEYLFDEANFYRFSPRVSPADAASLAERPIDLALIDRSLTELGARSDFLLGECVGGLMEPLTEGALNLDLIAKIGFPVVLVAPSDPKSINGVLLTVRALEQAGQTIAGIVLNRLNKAVRPEEATAVHQIDRFTHSELLRGVFPYLDEPGLVDGDLLAKRCESHIDLNAMLG